MKTTKATKGNGNGKAILEPVTNDAEFALEMERPYIAEVEITGSTDILFHAWSIEDVENKAAAAKGSATKKFDNLEAAVYRDKDGYISIPGMYLRGAIVAAAKFHQDPRSPRKSAMDLFKATVFPANDMVRIIPRSMDSGVKEWEYVARHRVTIQRNAITRSRPAFYAGWKATFQFQVAMPHYVSPVLLNQVIAEAGQFVGVADFRPTYGRFQVTRFKVLDLK